VEELEYGLNNPELLNSVDAKNGNYPLHIAAQNGHRTLCALMVSKGAKVNAQNGTGTTPLHMALEYDYWFIAKHLMENGADTSIENQDGNKAGAGIGGEKSIDDFVPALITADTADEVNFALDKIKEQSGVDKAALVQAGMAKKRSAKDIWSGDIQTKFMEIVKSL
jgi:ankyrin repeat protein